MARILNLIAYDFANQLIRLSMARFGIQAAFLLLYLAELFVVCDVSLIIFIKDLLYVLELWPIPVTYEAHLFIAGK